MRHSPFLEPSLSLQSSSRFVPFLSFFCANSSPPSPPPLLGGLFSWRCRGRLSIVARCQVEADWSDGLSVRPFTSDRDGNCYPLSTACVDKPSTSSFLGAVYVILVPSVDCPFNIYPSFPIHCSSCTSRHYVQSSLDVLRKQQHHR